MEIVTSTGHRPAVWEGVLLNWGAPAILLLFAAALAFPQLRRFLERTAFASFALFAVAVLCVIRFWVGALADLAGDAPSSTRIGNISVDWQTLSDWIARPSGLLLLKVALALFLLAQSRRLVFGTPRPIRPIDPGLLDGADVGQLPTGSWFKRLWGVITAPFTRSRIIRDFNAAPLLLQDKSFSPFAFAVQLAVVAGVPASVLGALNSLGGHSAPPSEALGVLAYLYDSVKPFSIPAVILFLSWLGAISLVRSASTRLQLVRRLYLTIDSTVSFWPTMILALVAALGFPSQVEADHFGTGLASALSDVIHDWFRDDWYEWGDGWAALGEGFVKQGVAVSLFASTWLAPLWLITIRLIRTPRIVGALVPGVSLVAHAIVFSVWIGALGTLATYLVMQFSTR